MTQAHHTKTTTPTHDSVTHTRTHTTRTSTSKRANGTRHDTTRESDRHKDMTRHVHITGETSQPNQGKAEPTNPHMHKTHAIVVMVLCGKFQAVSLFPVGNSDAIRCAMVRERKDNRLRERHRERSLVANLVYVVFDRWTYVILQPMTNTQPQPVANLEPARRTVANSLANSWQILNQPSRADEPTTTGTSDDNKPNRAEPRHP